jgi:adenine-specific DNA-methyltransferase
MQKLDGKSMDIVSENIEKLKELFPEVFSEGKIDFTKLQEELGEFTDKENERYNFTWNGKQEAKRIAQTPSTGTLRPSKEDSKDWDTTQNLYIEGDNLEVLKLLQKSYHKKVKMIYIDPPYNTGKDFVYKDNFRDNIKNYMEQTGQINSDGNRLSTNSDTSGRYHSDWLSMMYPRLKLARNLLKDDGVIFISIDDCEQINLKKICDEIFGEDNFIASLTVINNMKGRNDKANIATSHEYLLMYSKMDFESFGLPLTNEQLQAYKFTDSKGEKYALRDLRKRGRPDRREDRPNMYFPIYFNQKENICSLERMSEADIEITPQKGDGSDGRWRWGKERVGNNLDILEPKYSKKNDKWGMEHRIYLKIETDNLDEETDDGDQDFIKTSKSKSFWWGGDISTDVGNREFKKIIPEINPDYPKSPFLIDKLLHMSSTADDIILDFFSGYATTSQAIMNLNSEDRQNRKYIMVQIPEQTNIKDFPTICEIGKERIRRAGDKIITDNPDKDLSKLDIGFKVYKLDSSNIKEWDSDFDNLETNLLDAVDNIKSDRTSEDLLYEILLKYGLDLTLPIEELTIEGKTVYNIGFGAFVVCLDDNITITVVEAIAEFIKEQVVYDEEKKKRHARVVFKDKSFADTNIKTNAIQVLKQFDVDEVVSI